MQKTKNVSAGKWVALVIALLFMFATKYIPAPADLSQASGPWHSDRRDHSVPDLGHRFPQHDDRLRADDR